MEWLLGKRVAIQAIGQKSVNDAIIKGRVSNDDSIGFEVEPDSEKSTISLTWKALDSLQMKKLSE